MDIGTSSTTEMGFIQTNLTGRSRVWGADVAHTCAISEGELLLRTIGLSDCSPRMLRFFDPVY